MSKKIFAWLIPLIIVVIVIIAILAFTVWKPQPKQEETIKIGAILPLTGGMGFVGQSVRNALVLAQEQLGDTKYKYEVIFEDSKLDLKETATVANKLINIDKVDVIISQTSGPGNVITPLAEANKVIHFGIASDSKIAKGKYNFIHWTQPEEQSKVFINELQKRGIKKIAIFELNQEGIKTFIDVFKKNIEGTDIEIVADFIFNPGERDFKTMVLKAKEKNPEIYLILTFSPELEILAKQIKELGIETPLTSVQSFEFTEQPELFEGYWYVNPADPNEEYFNLYKQKYGENPRLGSGNAYDIFNMIVFAYEKAGKDKKGKPSKEEVIAELENIKGFKGALGELNMMEEGIVWSNAIVKQVKDGKFVRIE